MSQTSLHLKLVSGMWLCSPMAGVSSDVLMELWATLDLARPCLEPVRPLFILCYMVCYAILISIQISSWIIHGQHFQCEFWVTCVSSYVCDLQQQQQPLAVMQIFFFFRKKANLVTSSLLFITSASPFSLLHEFQRFQQQSLPPARVSTVPPPPPLPGGHEAGHAEVKVPISPELGPLSHLFLQNCGKSAGQRRTHRLVGRSVILFQTWCFSWTPWPNATLTLIWVQPRCWTGRSAAVCGASREADGSGIWKRARRGGTLSHPSTD